MVAGYGTTPELDEGMRLITERIELKRQLAELEQEAQALRELNAALMAEVHRRQQEDERREAAELEAAMEHMQHPTHRRNYAQYKAPAKRRWGRWWHRQ